MNCKVIFKYLLLIVLLSNCKDNKISDLNFIVDDQEEINQRLINYKTTIQLDSLISFGLYNLAFESILKNENYFSDQEKIEIATQFIDNGEFDKGLAIANNINQQENYFEIIRLKLQSALKKEDTTRSRLLLDSLKINPQLKKNKEMQVEFNLFKGYQAHNTNQYLTSIAINEQVLKDVQLFNLPKSYLIKAYRRLGNDYNDIVRNNISFNKSAIYCFKKGVYYYQKELELLLKSEYANQTKIALNYFTTAMIYYGFNKKYDVLPYYKKALNSLIVANNNDFIITRNPIYTSIALSQLGFLLIDENERDSILDLNQTLINVRSFYKVNDHQSLDIIDYFPQRSQEIKILSSLKASNSKQSIIEILSLSNHCKYPNQFIYKNLQNQFGEYANRAIKNWILLNEILVFGAKTNNNSTVRFAEKCLSHYNRSLKEVIAQRNIKIDDEDVSKLKLFCKNNNSTIIDFQKLFSGNILAIKIDEKGVFFNQFDNENALTQLEVTQLNDAINSNDFSQYSSIAHSIYKKLDLESVKTKNIIICPDEFLEKIPFDALIRFYKKSKLWSDFEFVGKTQNIQLVPNIQSLIQTPEIQAKLEIDLWSSKIANSTLPYNESLIAYLKNDLSATCNQVDPKNILHILAHTHRTAENNIEFLLDNDTITIDNSGCKTPILTILEGCSSGDGKILRSEGSLSLTRSFLYKNTPTVIYSIWDADNHSSSALFKQFYSYLLKGVNTSDALHKAKNDLLNDHLHPEWSSPYYWANYQITGKNILFAK